MTEDPFLPEPMRVSDAIIARCRAEIDGRSKRIARRIAIPILRWRYGIHEVGEGFHWGLPLYLKGNGIRIGRYCYIGAYGTVYRPLIVGDICMISSFVRFIGNDHRIDVVGGPARLEAMPPPKVTIIEADCWIGQGAMIRTGVRIGRGAVVGAGAVVTKSVAPYEVVAGVPARRLRMRFDETGIREHDRILYDKL